MMIVGPNRTATATYKADSNEVNTNSKVNILDNKAANVQSIKMAMQSVLVDSFGGQVFFSVHTPRTVKLFVKVFKNFLPASNFATIRLGRYLLTMRQNSY